jgi:hypothetical protein
LNDRIKRIQIYGERCSGTNYLEDLLRRNVKSAQITWEFGWKHFFYRPGVEDANDCLFLVIYRNPFDWLRSLHRNPWHAAPPLRSLNFSDFIRAEWWCIHDEHSRTTPTDPRYGTEIVRERDPETNERFANVLRLRTAKIRNWESLREKTSHHIAIKYEDLDLHPREVVGSICQTFGLKRRYLFRGAKGYKGSKAKYVPKAYEPINAEDLDYILHELDVELERSIGYDLQTMAAQHAAAGERSGGPPHGGT